MKIKKEFIPLILSGRKEYEFRDNDNCDGVYKIIDRYYLLEYLGCGELEKDEEPLLYKNTVVCTNYNTDDVNQIEVEIDKGSLEFINDNKGYGDFHINVGVRVIHIYKGNHCPLKELETV